MSDAPMVVHLYDDRRMTFSPWSIGNSKIGSGPGVYTYSRLPISTCPGATDWCKANCYARRVDGPVRALWEENSNTDSIRDFVPEDARLVRIHVSGDFDSIEYIEDWIALTEHRSDVSFFGYTRSWRIAALAPSLIELRDRPNVQLFASVDPGTPEADIAGLLVEGWRLSRIEEPTHGNVLEGAVNGMYCPEQTGDKESCDDCGFCWRGTKRDVTFIAH